MSHCTIVPRTVFFYMGIAGVNWKMFITYCLSKPALATHTPTLLQGWNRTTISKQGNKLNRLCVENTGYQNLFYIFGGIPKKTYCIY